MGLEFPGQLNDDGLELLGIECPDRLAERAEAEAFDAELLAHFLNGRRLLKQVDRIDQWIEHVKQ
jgi:hypothetical protein